MAGKIFRNKKISIPTLVVSVVIAFFLIKGIMLQPEITRNKEEIDSLNTQIAEQQEKLKELEQLAEKVDTDEYIEKVAREKLGLIKENEIIFIDISGNKQ